MKLNIALFLIFICSLPLHAQEKEYSSLLTVDYKNLVSRADLVYNQPVTRSEAGMPIGNGRMGSLVWTSPASLKLQLNRVDVFANNRNTHSFNQRDLDYSSGCGFLDISFVDFGEDVFPQHHTKQQLAVYNGLYSITGNGVKANALAWRAQDVMAFKVQDERAQPSAVNIKLNMLRPAEVYTKNHSAVSTLSSRNNYIILKQEFKEGDYYCSSALAVGVTGRAAMPRLNDATGGKVPITSSKTWRTPGLGQATETSIQLAVKPGQGTFEILAATAASFDPKEDVVATAIERLQAASAKGFDRLLEENTQWWQQYWNRSFVHLHSDDGVADEVEKNYTYFLYLMGSSSYGPYPPNFSGLIWQTLGDLSAWGPQQWWNNLTLYYRGLLAANRPGLMDPLFNIYSGMYDACSQAAKQVWGSKGIFIPETVWFDGPETLPDDIAAELQDLFLVRKPWSSRSLRFQEYAATQEPYVSIWNWRGFEKWVDGQFTFPDKGNGPFGHLTHLIESGAQLAYLYWKQYEYSMDKEWLRNRAYPMLKGVAEFYRNFPNVKKEQDGKYHIHLINNGERPRGLRDAIQSMAAMHSIFPVVIRASEILGTDAAMRPVWKEFLDNLAPMPVSQHPDAPVANAAKEPPYWINGLKPVIDGEVRSDLTPCIFFDLCTLETATRDSTIFNIGLNTYQHNYPRGMNDSTRVFVMSPAAIIAARLGRAADVKYAIPNQLACRWARNDFVGFDGTGNAGVLDNRMTLREGINAIDAERLGNVTSALHEALCQSNPAGPALDPVIRVFPAWPQQWDAAFTLLCRGGFMVTASRQKGETVFVEIYSQLGSICRIRNPWPGKPIVVYKNGKKISSQDKTLLTFPTQQQDHFIILPAGVQPEAVKGKIL